MLPRGEKYGINLITFCSSVSILALFSNPFLFLPLEEHGLLERPWVVDFNELGLELES